MIGLLCITRGDHRRQGFEFIFCLGFHKYLPLEAILFEALSDTKCN